MGSKEGLKRGAWTAEEDQKLISFIQRNNGRHGSWRTLPRLAGLQRCGKSCRLRWTNYLRPNIKRGSFSLEEERMIIHLHSFLGNRWSNIASHLAGRTDNDVKNHWNTHLKKRLLRMGINPSTHLSLTTTTKGGAAKPPIPPPARRRVMATAHLYPYHVVQWELARLEEQSKLVAMPPSPSPSPSPPPSDPLAWLCPAPPLDPHHLIHTHNPFTPSDSQLPHHHLPSSHPIHSSLPILNNPPSDLPPISSDDSITYWASVFSLLGHASTPP